MCLCECYDCLECLCVCVCSLAFRGNDCLSVSVVTVRRWCSLNALQCMQWYYNYYYRCRIQWFMWLYVSVRESVWVSCVGCCHSVAVDMPWKYCIEYNNIILMCLLTQMDCLAHCMWVSMSEYVGESVCLWVCCVACCHPLDIPWKYCIGCNQINVLMVIFNSFRCDCVCECMWVCFWCDWENGRVSFGFVVSLWYAFSVLHCMQ